MSAQKRKAESARAPSTGATPPSPESVRRTKKSKEDVERVLAAFIYDEDEKGGNAGLSAAFSSASATVAAASAASVVASEASEVSPSDATADKKEKQIWYILTAEFEHAAVPKSNAKLDCVPKQKITFYETASSFVTDAEEFLHDLKSQMMDGSDTDTRESDNDHSGESDSGHSSSEPEDDDRYERRRADKLIGRLSGPDIDYALIDSNLEERHEADDPSITYHRHHFGTAHVDSKLEFHQLIACVSGTIEDTSLVWVVHVCDYRLAHKWTKKFNTSSIDDAAEADQTGVISARHLLDYFDGNRCLKKDLSNDVVQELAAKYLAKSTVWRVVYPQSFIPPGKMKKVLNETKGTDARMVVAKGADTKAIEVKDVTANAVAKSAAAAAVSVPSAAAAATSLSKSISTPDTNTLRVANRVKAQLMANPEYSRMVELARSPAE